MNQLSNAPQGEELEDIFAEATRQPFQGNQLENAPTEFELAEMFGEVAREPEPVNA